MIGFMFGALAAACWFVAAEHLFNGASAPEPRRRAHTPSPDVLRPQPESITPSPALALVEKPLIARLQEADVIRTLGAILAIGGGVDLTRIGWPTLRPGFPLTTLLNAWRDMRAAMARRAGGKIMPVMALVGAGDTTGRSVTALNFALAAARDGSRVLMIDADHQAHTLSSRINRPGKSEPGKLGWLSIGNKAAREIKTVNGISVLPATGSDAGKAADAISKAIAQARSAGGYDLVILDGPEMPLSAAGRKLLDGTDALVAVLPTSLDINDSMEDILTALGGAQRKLVGVVLDELTPATQTRQRGKQYA
jgi:Mrp family chromosome partitioning ATPase